MYHVAGILTRGDAPERVVGCPQGCAQAVDKVVDKYLRKKVGLTQPSATHNDNHFHLINQTLPPRPVPMIRANELSYWAVSYQAVTIQLRKLSANRYQIVT